MAEASGSGNKRAQRGGLKGRVQYGLSVSSQLRESKPDRASCLQPPQAPRKADGMVELGCATAGLDDSHSS